MYRLTLIGAALNLRRRCSSKQERPEDSTRACSVRCTAATSDPGSSLAPRRLYSVSYASTCFRDPLVSPPLPPAYPLCLYCLAPSGVGGLQPNGGMAAGPSWASKWCWLHVTKQAASRVPMWSFPDSVRHFFRGCCSQPRAGRCDFRCLFFRRASMWTLFSFCR